MIWYDMWCNVYSWCGSSENVFFSVISSTFRSRRDWSEPHNLGINFAVIRHFSSSLQNAYSSEELNGLSYYKTNQFSFSLGAEWGGFVSPPDPWPGALPLDPAGALPRYRLALHARHVVRPLFRRNRRHWVCPRWRSKSAYAATATPSSQSYATEGRRGKERI